MLWYKAWRETQVRFGLSAVTLAALCSGLVLFYREAAAGLEGESLSYRGFVWQVTYKGYLRDLFEIAALMLGLGGLLPERAHGTAGFTLALPVSRRRLLGTRIAVGVLEIAVLAFLPAVIIPALSPLVSQGYPWSEGWQFGVLWAAGGSLIFVLGILASLILDGEYAAPIGALMLLVLYSGLAEVPFLERYVVNIHDLMSGNGMTYFDMKTFSLTGPFPWTALVATGLMAFGLVALATTICQRRDF
jgi:ABC-2 type transport system permease protein